VISTNGYCIVRKIIILYNSEWTIFKITALSAPYSVNIAPLNESTYQVPRD
jgi:hypothetical protein